MQAVFEANYLFSIDDNETISNSMLIVAVHRTAKAINIIYKKVCQKFKFCTPSHHFLLSLTACR